MNRWIVQFWFCLVGLSTILTHQHHVVDIIGGLVLAILCLSIVRDNPVPGHSAKCYRIAAYYGLASVSLMSIAVFLGPWGWLLWWIAIAMAVVATGYLGLGASIYRKQAGCLPLSARILLAPVLCGQYLSLLYYRRRCRPWDQVLPGVWLGRQLNCSEAAEIVRRGVTAVLDLTAEFSEAKPLRTREYLNLPVLDLTAPANAQLEDAAAFIATHSLHGRVYVHCKIGYSRSVAAVAAYLLRSGRSRSVEEAVQLIRHVRPTVAVRPEIWTTLRQFHRSRDQRPRSIYRWPIDGTESWVSQ